MEYNFSIKNYTNGLPLVFILKFLWPKLITIPIPTAYKVSHQNHKYWYYKVFRITDCRILWHRWQHFFRKNVLICIQITHCRIFKIQNGAQIGALHFFKMFFLGSLLGSLL